VFALPVPAGATTVRIETYGFGGFNVELFDTAPLTVANFLTYMSRGNATVGGYDATIIHRSAKTYDAATNTNVPFIVQGGGYGCCNPFDGNPIHIGTSSPVPNEFSPSRSNVRGTIAMAKLDGDPDSATNEWFINLGDNSANLDKQNGGFTVFGRVLDPGMDVVDTIAALDTSNQFVWDENLTSKYLISDVPKLKNGSFVFVTRICDNNDGDGVCSDIEDLAPNNGDGNEDRIPDRDQPNVTTIQTLLGTTATFAAESTMRLDPVYAVSTSTATSWLTIFKSPPDQSVYFNNGMFNLTMLGNMGATGHTLTVYDGASTRPTRYYAFGPTLDDQALHWYDFSFDGVTGAEIKSDRIVLHFVDGMRGDGDLVVNNSISHIGAQAVVTENANSSSQSGGGCSIATTTSGTPRGGDWIVVFLFLAFVALVRRHAPHYGNSE